MTSQLEDSCRHEPGWMRKRVLDSRCGENDGGQSEDPGTTQWGFSFLVFSMRPDSQRFTATRNLACGKSTLVTLAVESAEIGMFVNRIIELTQ